MAGELIAGVIEIAIRAGLWSGKLALDALLDHKAISDLTHDQRQAFLEGLVLAARDDGREDPEEKHILEASARTLLEGDAEERLAELDRARAACAVASGPEDVLALVRAVGRRLGDDRKRNLLLRSAAVVAAASPEDGTRRALVHRFADVLELDRAKGDEHLAAAETARRAADEADKKKKDA